jgi:uncharacterized lipoprotein YddW (UPF0748 family)
MPLQPLRLVRALALILACVLSLGCRGIEPPRMRTTVRALWVTRFDFKTRADVETIIENAAHAGINRILFQVRGNATALYRSSIEPWAEQFGFQDPGFDPLAVAIELAHARGIELHAWVNVVPAWWGKTPPSDPKQVYNAHPDWLWYDQNGKRQELSERFYVSLNPCLPEVRKYIVSVLRDIAGRYGIDGLHLDYLRFPNEAPATPAGSGLDYPRDARTSALFEADTGKRPDQDPAAWKRWRTAQITTLLQEIRYMLKSTRTQVELSAAVGPVPERALHEHFQDSQAWIEARLLDTLYPMNYASTLEAFAERSVPWKAIESGGKVDVVMGVRIGAADVKLQRELLASALRSFDGFAMFAYASLWDSPGDELEKQDEATRAARAALRKELVPILKDMARSGAGAAR